MQHASRPVHLASFVVLAVVGGMLALASPAHAAVPEPTVHIEDGGDGFLNAQEITDGVMLSGTYDTGAGITSITARVTKEPCLSTTAGTPTQGATLNPDGAWEAGPFDLSDTGTFPEGTETCARAVATDGGTNSDVAVSDNRSVIDRIAPDPGTLTIDDGDGFINADDVASGVPVQIEADPLSDAVSATVWFEDSAANIPSGCGPFTGAATRTGSLNPTCAGNLPDGTVLFAGTWADEAGNMSSEAGDTTVKDTVAPTWTVQFRDGVIIDGVRHIAEPHIDAGVRLRWLADEDGGTVEASLANTGSEAPAECVFTGRPRGYPTQRTERLFHASCFDELLDGELTATVAGGDLAGNAGSGSVIGILDREGPAIDITEVTDPINAAAQTSTDASGTTDPGATVDVSATDGALDLGPFPATVDGDGNWSVSGIDVSTLADGTVTYVAVATNALGNASQASVDALKKTTIPAAGTAAIDDGDGFVNAADAASGVPVSWTEDPGADVAGAEVWFQWSNSSIRRDNRIPDGCGPFIFGPSGTDSLNPDCAANLPEGTFRFFVQWFDDVDNRSSLRSVASVKDTIPPAVSISMLDGDGIVTAAEASSGVTIDWDVDETGPDVEVGVANVGAAAPAECLLTDQPRVGSEVFDMDCFGELDEGPIVATVTGVDLAGNSASATDDSNLHVTAGVFSFDLPQFINAERTSGDSSPIGTETINLDRDASTVVSPVSATMTATDEEGNTASDGPKLLGDGSSEEDWAFQIDLSDLVEGEVTFVAEMTDSFGQTTTVTRTSILDLTTPVSTWTTESGAQFFRLSVPFTPLRFSTVSLEGETVESPATSDIQLVYLIGTRVDGGGYFAQPAAKSHPNASEVTWQLNTSSLGPGTWRFQVQSQDYAGNLETDGPTIEVTVYGAV